MDVSGKACLVTGGARGIGEAIVEALLKRGAKVVIGDILHKEGEATWQRLASIYGKANVAFVRLDVASSSNFELAFLTCIDLFGQVDILVNNAGINAETSWETQLDINLKGTIRGSKLALRFMAKNGRVHESSRKGGAILNVSSIQGLVNWPAMPSYSAGKAGIITYTRCAGHQVEFEEHGVAMTALCPFGVLTPMQDFEVYTGMSKAGERYLKQQDVKTRILNPVEVGEAAVRVIEQAETATVWYLHKSGDKPYLVPDHNTFEYLLKLKPS